MLIRLERPLAVAAVTWLSAAEDGRRTGPPTAPVYASTCLFPLGGETETVPGWPVTGEMLSILLERIDGAAEGRQGRYRVGFLVPDLAMPYLHVGAGILVTEGSRVVATAVVLEVVREAIALDRPLYGTGESVRCSPMTTEDAMSESTLDLMRAALPVQIREIAVHDPFLGLYGDGWALNLMCPYRIDGPGWHVFWESDDIEDPCWDLIGHSIVGVEADDPEVVDPTFLLDGGIRVIVRADTDLEPWTLSLPDLFVVGPRWRSPSGETREPTWPPLPGSRRG